MFFKPEAQIPPLLRCTKLLLYVKIAMFFFRFHTALFLQCLDFSISEILKHLKFEFLVVCL